MSYQSDLALLAAGSYWDIRQDDRVNTPEDEGNRAPLPEGWKVLTQFDKSDSGPAAQTGFSARVYRNISSGEIVISYAGTEFGNTSAQGTKADFINGNLPLAVGDYGSQAYLAAALYQQVKATGLANISFTGHSLGGGLAAIMGVWFNRPAYVYAPAPFEKSVDQTQLTDKTTTVAGQTIVEFTADQVRVLPLVKAELLRKTGVVDPALASYNPITNFASREQNISAWAIKGELLEKTLFVLNWIEKSPRTSLYDSSAVTLGFSEKHSIDLHAAALLVPNFETQAKAVGNALKLLMDDKLYSTNILGSQQHIIMKLLRNEVGIRGNDGTLLKPSTQMLTHFAADLGKIASNLTSPNQAAQNAIVAQGIEWYYWQSNDYAGQEFISVTSNTLQYTTAQGDGLTGALNKANLYTTPWLTALFAQTNQQPIKTDYQQWNVATSAGGTAIARDTNKDQIFIGNDGADNFTGGSKDDALIGAGGNDTFNGQGGNDQLFGGQGSDTYIFTGQFDHDTLTDLDGQGNIQLNGTALSGSFKGIGKRGAYGLKHADGTGVGLAIYSDASSSTGKSAVLRFSGSDANQITIKNFDETAAKSTSGNGYLGIKIDPEQSIVIKASDYTTEGNPFKELDFNASTFAAGAAGRQQDAQTATTNSIALCAHGIWARGRFGVKNLTCTNSQKFKKNRPKTHVFTARSAIEFVVKRSSV